MRYTPVVHESDADIPHRNKIHDEILRGTEEINRLHRRLHEVFKSRDANEDAHLEWKQAAEFRARYHLLAFPFGFDEEQFFAVLNRNDRGVVEWAVSFLEARPHFIRSGYVWTKLLRRLKHVELSIEQQQRFDNVLSRYRDWRARSRSRPSPSAI